MNLATAIETLLSERPLSVERIVTTLIEASRLPRLDDLESVVRVAVFDDGLFSDLLAVPAMALLPAWGEEGIDHLCEIVCNGSHAASALAILTIVSRGRIPTSGDPLYSLPSFWDRVEKYALDQEVAAHALQHLRELVLEHLADPRRRGSLLWHADFVVRRTNDEYIVVEIENSTDQLFTRDGRFTADLATAIAQVRDFQAWISDNIAYARTKLPGIRHPDGLVVIGRRGTLTPLMATRLSEENFSRRGHIEVVTYDDLLNQARAVYQNAITRPLVLRSRDQKTI